MEKPARAPRVTAVSFELETVVVGLLYTIFKKQGQDSLQVSSQIHLLLTE